MRNKWILYAIIILVVLLVLTGALYNMTNATQSNSCIHAVLRATHAFMQCSELAQQINERNSPTNNAVEVLRKCDCIHRLDSPFKYKHVLIL